MTSPSFYRPCGRGCQPLGPASSGITTGTVSTMRSRLTVMGERHPVRRMPALTADSSQPSLQDQTLRVSGGIYRVPAIPRTATRPTRRIRVRQLRVFVTLQLARRVEVLGSGVIPTAALVVVVRASPVVDPLTGLGVVVADMVRAEDGPVRIRRGHRRLVDDKRLSVSRIVRTEPLMRLVVPIRTSIGIIPAVGGLVVGYRSAC